jgi:hypothetical protein
MTYLEEMQKVSMRLHWKVLGLLVVTAMVKEDMGSQGHTSTNLLHQVAT